MMYRLNSLRKTIEKLLPDVDGVLAPRSGPSRVVSPYLFCKEHLEELANLAIWPEQPVSEALKLILRAHPGAKLAIACRGCEERGIIEMFKHTLLNQNNLTLIGLQCKQSEAKFCRCAKPFTAHAKTLVDQPIERLPDPLTDEITVMGMIEKLASWKQETNLPH